MRRDDGFGDAWAARGEDRGTEALDAAARRRLERPDLGHDEVLVTLAAALGGSDPEALPGRLDDAARAAFGAAARELPDQAERVMEALFTELGVRAAHEHGELLLGHGLATGVLHPMAMAATGHELARRAGLRSIVATSHPGWWTVLVRDDACLPIGFGQGTEIESLPDLRGCCPHQLAHELLARLADRGPAPLAGRAERLRISLARMIQTDASGH